MKKETFAEKAEKKKISSLEELDKLLYVVKPRAWIALLVCLSLVIGVTFWSVFAKIYTLVQAEGIYLDPSKLVFISVPSGGKIVEIKVTIGDSVKEGQVIAVVLDKQNHREEIPSPFAGTILDLHIARESTVETNALLASVQKQTNESSFEDRFYCFVPAEEGDKIKQGMNVIIYPWAVDKNLYGGIFGRVEKITYLPASKEYFENIFINESLAQKLTQNRPFVPLIVKPLVNPDDPNAFLWTSGKGPSRADIPLGGFATVEIKVQERSPISYLLPFWVEKKAPE